jgi:hypothetical protein
MSESIAAEIWGELKRFVNTVDRAEAAETLVAVLIDHDESAESIRNAFKGDADVKRALAVYLDTDAEYEDEEPEDDDNDWEN